MKITVNKISSVFDTFVTQLALYSVDNSQTLNVCTRLAFTKQKRKKITKLLH
jgi:hypothetical protein